MEENKKNIHFILTNCLLWQKSFRDEDLGHNYLDQLEFGTDINRTNSSSNN